MAIYIISFDIFPEINQSTNKEILSWQRCTEAADRQSTKSIWPRFVQCLVLDFANDLRNVMKVMFSTFNVSSFFLLIPLSM